MSSKVRCQSLISKTVAILMMAGVNCAMAANGSYDFSLPEQSLADSLRAVGSRAGVNVVFDPASVQDKRAPLLQGSYSVSEALQRLLEGSGLRIRTTEGGSFLIEGVRRISALGDTPASQSGRPTEETRSSSEDIDTVVVKGTTIDDPILSSRTGDTLRERPQSISIVTRQRLDEQNLNSLGSALEQTTGITVVKESNSAQQFYSRGFEINNVQVDGGAALVVNAGGYDQTIDLAFYEQIEVLRGADALSSGNARPGGSIQLVRKRPTRTTQLDAEASISRWGAYRGQLDVAGSLALDGRLRGRAVYMSESSKTFQTDLSRGNKDAVYAVMEADATDSTRLSLGASYSKSETPLGSFGLPRYSDGRDLGLPRSEGLTPDWSKVESDTGEVFASIDQRLGDSWSVRLNAMRSRKESDFRFNYSFAAIDPTNPIGTMYGENGQRTAVQNVVDLTLKGSFELWGRTHKLAVGADWQKRETDGPGWDAPAFTFDPFAFNPGAYPVPSRSVEPASFRTFGNEQNGLYVSLSLQAAQPLRILGGARYSNYKYTAQYQYRDFPFFNSTQRYEDRDVVTPYVGFTYDLPRNWVTYGSYAETFESQASTLSGPFPGRPLDPMTGETFELGVKGELGSGRAATQIAVYQIERNNEAVLDPSFPPQSGELGSSCCYRAQGVIESRGLDAEVSGNLTDRWNFFAGYTLNRNEYKSGYASNLGATYMPQTPRHLFKLWSTYRFAGDLSRLRLGAGVTAQTKSFVRGTVVEFDSTGQPVGSVPYQFSQGAYAIVSARGEYALNETWSAAVNLDNILDKTYYQTIGNTFARNWYGQPRSYTLTIRGRW